ncbi:MAG: glycosyltransferase family 39 protein [Flavobacteriales bacterium]|nr:glycosyltransferase family 39 protein [Flavobacteriales bacterium]
MIAKYNKQFVIVALGALILLPFLGGVHLFDWDEINFAESSREMMITGNYFQNQINFEPFWEKPPLFFWIQSISMSVFGQNEFGARFPNAIVGIITLLLIFSIGKKLYNERFGLIWVLLYIGSILPHLYMRSGIIDPTFNLLIFTAIYYLIRTVEETNHNIAKNHAALSGFFIGLAIITKGPVALLILILTSIAFWALNRFKPIASIKNLFLFALVAFLTSFLWFGYETIKNGPWFLGEFLAYQIELLLGTEGGAAAGHQQPFYYHFVVILLGCFPISLLALGNLFGSKYLEDKLNFRGWMTTLFWIVLVLFSLVSTKIIHYSSMAYLPLSFMAAYYLYQVDRGKEKMSKWIIWFITIMGLLFSIAIALIPLAAMNKDTWLIPSIKDQFIVDGLATEVVWSGYEMGVGVIFGLFVIMAIRQLFRKKIIRFVVTNAIGVSFMMIASNIILLPKIEAYVQRPAIDFYKTLKDKDAYIWPLHHKSYAHYFYAKTQPLDSTAALFTHKKQVLRNLGYDKISELKNENRLTYQMNIQNWLMEGPIDKPVYFIMKSTFYTQEKFNNCQKVMQKGGFVALKRNPD